jgi:DNA-binding response OmpR family regulator
LKILLVEDDSRLCSRLRDDLGRMGYAVDVAENGVDAEHLALPSHVGEANRCYRAPVMAE